MLSARQQTLLIRGRGEGVFTFIHTSELKLHHTYLVYITIPDVVYRSNCNTIHVNVLFST